MPAWPLLQVENISLLANSKDVGYVGVNMYCDDQAQIKGLPYNPRASGLAEVCGKFIQVRMSSSRGQGGDAQYMRSAQCMRQLHMPLHHVTMPQAAHCRTAACQCTDVALCQRYTGILMVASAVSHAGVLAT
jgi:hypothetical protein